MWVLINPELLQALPIFLDKLLSPVLAVVLSVTAVLLVGKDKICAPWPALTWLIPACYS